MIVPNIELLILIFFFKSISLCFNDRTMSPMRYLFETRYVLCWLIYTQQSQQI